MRLCAFQPAPVPHSSYTLALLPVMRAGTPEAEPTTISSMPDRTPLVACGRAGCRASSAWHPAAGQRGRRAFSYSYDPLLLSGSRSGRQGLEEAELIAARVGKDGEPADALNVGARQDCAATGGFHPRQVGVDVVAAEIDEELADLRLHRPARVLTRANQTPPPP